MNILTVEQRLMLLTTRLTFSEADISEIEKIVESKKINWFEFYKLALYHKSFTLCWHNIKKIVPSFFPSKYLVENINYSYICTTERNRLYQDEIKQIIELLKEHDITCIPVKGATLIPEMYKDFGIRYSGDADFLMRYTDIGRVEKVIDKLGYIKGSYDSGQNKIIPIPRSEDIYRKMNYTNLYPYRKISNNTLFPFYKLDFRFSLDDKTVSKEPVNEIIESYIHLGYVKKCHILMHLCAHFYGEATYVGSIKNFKDFNLIKLCDIREYIMHNESDQLFDELIDFADRYRLNKMVYFTFSYLSLAYGDTYEEKLMKRMNISDIDFLNQYSDMTKNKDLSFKKGFIERLFSCNNNDELDAE